MRIDAAQSRQRFLCGESAPQQIEPDLAVHRLCHRLGGDDPLTGYCEWHAAAHGKSLRLGRHTHLAGCGVPADDRVGHVEDLPRTVTSRPYDVSFQECSLT